MELSSRSRAPARIARLLLVLLLAFAVLLAGGLPGGTPVDAEEDAPHFNVEPATGFVGGGGWLAGAPVTVTVGDVADPVETASDHVDDGGWFRITVDAELPPGTLVTVSDGETDKDHVVVTLALDVDPATAVAAGEAEPGTTVTVQLLEWPDGPGGPSTVHEEDVVADAEGVWSVDLAASGFELGERHMVFAIVIDDDGDGTLRVWSPPSARLQVYPEIDEVRGTNFAARTEVEITIDGGEAITVETDADGAFGVEVDHDLEPGLLVTATDGAQTREHVIFPLAILDIDVYGDVVSGVGEPGYQVLVGHLPEAGELPSHLRSAPAAADGTWSIDFSDEQPGNPLGAPLDIEHDMSVFALQQEDDGDLTGVFATATDPVVGVCPAPSDTPTFSDVASGNVHVDAIDCAAYHEIALGFADDTYRPALSVRRDQMASFVVRTLEAAGHTLPDSDHAFIDVAGNVHADSIGRLAAADIVLGTSETTYDPDRMVARDQMASYLVRALEWAQGSTLTASESPFTDIAGNTHEEAIEIAYDRGLTTGRTDTTYEPRTDVRRDQMATFLVRLLPQAMDAA
jgi:hypothetical protein